MQYHTKEELKQAVKDNTTAVYLPKYETVRLKYKWICRAEFKIKAVRRTKLTGLFISPANQKVRFALPFNDVLLTTHKDFDKIMNEKVVELKEKVQQCVAVKKRDYQRKKVYTSEPYKVVKFMGMRFLYTISYEGAALKGIFPFLSYDSADRTCQLMNAAYQEGIFNSWQYKKLPVEEAA